MSIYNPEQKRAVWVEYVTRETRDRNRAYLQWNKPHGTWLTAEQQAQDLTYYDNHKVHKDVPIYDQYFDRTEGYNQKLHRDDRASRTGLNALIEEKNKPVPLLSSNAYGFRPIIETPSRNHVRVQCIQKGFFRSRGANLPLHTDQEKVSPD